MDCIASGWLLNVHRLRTAALAAACGVILWWPALSYAANAGGAAAGAQPLIDGVPGASLVRAKCLLCHEAGHITRSRLSRPEWDDTVKLMIKRGAPITPEEIPAILDYLTTHYGRPAN